MSNTFVVGGVTFTALRRHHPVPHWALRIDETGKIMEPSNGSAIPGESRPKIKAYLEYIFKRITKGNTDLFKWHLDIPTQS